MTEERGRLSLPVIKPSLETLMTPFRPEKYLKTVGLRLVYTLDIFQVEMTSFMFLSQHWHLQAIFYLLNIHKICFKNISGSDQGFLR